MIKQSRKKEISQSILKLVLGYLIGLPILYLIDQTLRLIKIHELHTHTWVTLISFFVWFYVAGLVNRKTNPILLLLLYPAVLISYLMNQLYIPMIVYIVTFATIGLVLTRKEISKKTKYILSAVLTVLFGYFLFSQPLIIEKEGFGVDLENNLVNATVVWDFSKKTFPTVPTEDFLTQNGEKVNLSQFKGKTIFVTFWATWCGPCMAEKPDLEILKKEMDNTNEVIFIDISFDSDKKRWNNYLSKNKPKGIQLRSQNSGLTRSNFEISGVPFHIIVNSEGFYRSCLGPQIDWSRILSSSSYVDRYVKTHIRIINHLPTKRTKTPIP